MCALEVGVDKNDINEKFGIMVKKGVFKSVARFITNDTEERLAEGIAQVFELYRRKALLGVELEPAILVCACRRRATDTSRHLAKGSNKLTDAMSPRAFHQARVELLHLDGLPDADGDLDGGEDQEIAGTIFERESANPTARIISTISLGEWLAGLAEEDVTLVGLRLEGHGLAEIAADVGKSITTVCHRLHSLGEDLALHAQVSVPRRARQARGAALAAA